MSVNTLQALAVFILAAVPGVIVLEMLEFRRARLRDREGVRALASYLILSALTWGSATVALGADSRLADLLDLARREASGSEVVDAYGELAGQVFLVAVGLGLLLWTMRAAAEVVGYRLAGTSAAQRFRALQWIARNLATGVTADNAWDDLLAQVKKRSRPQVVQLRLKNGDVVYGLLARNGRLDYEAEGRGLFLTAEFVDTSGRLVVVPDSAGLYVASDAVATVGFADFPVEDD